MSYVNLLMLRNSKLVSAMLILVFILSLSALPVYADNFTNGNKNSINSNSAANDLKNAKLLDKKDIIKIAEYHIHSYLKNDAQTKGKVIAPSNDFINLYDLNDNLFAYLVPLIEQGKGEIGYITIGAIEDGYDAYEIIISDKRVNEIKSIIGAKAAETKLIFAPPLSYMIKVNNDGKFKYYDVSKNARDGVDVTNDILKSRNDIEKVYKNIRATEHKSQIQRVLTNSRNPGLVSATAANEDVRLVNEAAFIPIYGSTTYYGGDQNWYIDTYKKDRGCGPTAAANSINMGTKVQHQL